MNYWLQEKDDFQEIDTDNIHEVLALLCNIVTHYTSIEFRPCWVMSASSNKYVPP